MNSEFKYNEMQYEFSKYRRNNETVRTFVGTFYEYFVRVNFYGYTFMIKCETTLKINTYIYFIKKIQKYLNSELLVISTNFDM